MLDTQVGQDPQKADPTDVAKGGWEALMAGKGHIVSGWKNKAQVAPARVMPQAMLAEQHRKTAELGSANAS
jgi:short-subunit dehydrogenase